jgi:hypothetical protein
MRSSLDREGEFSYALLSKARAKKAGYSSQVIQRVLSTLVTAACLAVCLD